MTRVHAIVDQARAGIIAIKWTRSTAYLMTRGATRSIQFSSRFDRGIKLHRTDVILPQSEALRRWSWFLAIGGDVRMLSDRTILIGWPSITPTSFHCGDAWNPPDRWISIGRPAVDSPHDRGARDQTNRDRPSSWSIIGRRRPCMEDPHDRGPIEPRLRRDRVAIERLLPLNRPYLILRRSTET